MNGEDTTNIPHRHQGHATGRDDGEVTVTADAQNGTDLLFDPS